ncbi:hypothetical protein GLW20_07685 [Virgibacillus halodenitrificans]|nr:hypothetical protein [Virgibacillus halodenitrificans]
MDLMSEVFTRLQKLNIYIIPQYLWLILLYYLMINTFYNLLIKFKENNPEIKIDFPDEFKSLNETILNTLSDWSIFFLFLSIALFFSGISIAFIYYLPVIRKNIKLAVTGSIGIELGLWLLLITVTYFLFKSLSWFFLFVIPLLSLITIYWDKNLKHRLFNL